MSLKNASRPPEFPNIRAPGNKDVTNVLKDIELIKRTKNYDKRLSRSEATIYKIVAELRRLNNDHLYQTTSIWVLINIFRLEPEVIREIMLQAGVPGVLFDILNLRMLSGSTRQYASELCFYLCSDRPYPLDQDVPKHSPISKFPEVHRADRLESQSLQGGLHHSNSSSSSFDALDQSISSEMSSSLGKDGLHAFIPYRIDERNMHHMKKLFDLHTDSTSSHSLSNGIIPSLYAINHDFSNINDIDNEDSQSIDSSSEGSGSSRSQPMHSYTLKQSNGLPLYSTHRPMTSLDQYKHINNSNGNPIFHIKPLTATYPTISPLENTSKIRRQLQSSTLPKPLKRPNTSTSTVTSSTVRSIDLGTESFKSSKLRSKLRLPSGLNAESSSIHEVEEDFPDFFSKLDPLALNVNIALHSLKEEGMDMGSMDEDNDDDQGDNYLSDGEDEEDDLDREISAYNKALHVRTHVHDNAYITQRRMRMRAEKLIDNRFMKRLFKPNKKSSVSVTDVQSLVARMEDLFVLMDAQATGFVSWEYFTRVLLALAPQHLLRADVIAFLDAQKCDMKSLIDYKEFVISGKVMVLESHMARTVLPVTGWLQRQRLYANDASTLTWKAHQRWYRTRKAKAAVWLMRRARNAFKLSDKFTEAVYFISLTVRRAKAVTFLLEVAFKAVQAEEKRAEAQRHLMLRCLQARKIRARMEESFVYLKQTAIIYGGIDKLLLINKNNPNNKNNNSNNKNNNINKIGEINIIDKMDMINKIRDKLSNKKQADMSKVYAMQYHRGSAMVYLKSRAAAAIRHCDRQDETLDGLIETAKRVHLQTAVRNEASGWLLQRAESAYEYCMVQDDVLLKLISTGTNAYHYLVRQDESLLYLLSLGQHAIRTVRNQYTAYTVLSNIGASLLRRLNGREDAFTYLKLRGTQAVRLEYMKKESFAFLKRYSTAIWENEATVNRAFTYLKNRGQRAITHRNAQLLASQKLTFMGGRSNVVSRNLRTAYSDLQQMGQYAKYLAIETQWCTIRENAYKVQQEAKRISQIDQTNKKNRKSLSTTDRWREELQEAFSWISKLYSPISTEELLGTVSTVSNVSITKTTEVIGRYGFSKLILDGKLLDLPTGSAFEYFSTIDTQHKCFVGFSEVFDWFLREAKELQENKNKNIKKNDFSVSTILSARTRATVSYFRRLAIAEMKTLQEGGNGLMSSYQMNSRVFNGLDDEGSAEGEDDEDSRDDDQSLEMARNTDLKYLVKGDALGDDINGKLMLKLRIK